MHELSIVFYVIDECKKVAAENNVKKINSVTVAIGEVSTVIPDYFADVWKWAVKKHEIMEDAGLLVEKIDAITHCEDCFQDYPTIPYGKTCPYCGSGNTYLLQGNEFMIKEIEVLDDEETE